MDMWRNGRRKGLKIPRPQGRAGSTPAMSTNKYRYSSKEEYRSPKAKIWVRVHGTGAN